MAIVGYQPVPSDSGPFQANFQDSNGRSFLMFGPEAEQAAQQIDQRQQYLAKNDSGAGGASGVPTSRSDVNYDMSPAGSGGAPNVSTAADNGGANMSTPEGGAVQAPPPDVPPPSPMQGAPTPQGNEAPQARPQIIGRTEKGQILTRNPDGSVWENVAPSGGSKGGLLEKTETQKGGIPEDPRYTQGMQANYANQQRVEELKYQQGVKQASYEQGYNQQMLKAQQAQAAEAAQKQQAIQRQVDDYTVRRQQAVDQLANYKIDPDRGVSTGEKVLSALSIGLGTFAAIRSKTPNYALQIHEAQVQQRIHAQEAQMKVLGAKADNTLVDLKDRLGSLDAAKSAYASAANAQSATQLKMLASKTSDEQQRNNYLDLANKLEASNLKQTEEDRIRHLGEVTKNFQNMPKVAPTAGGYRPATLAESQAAATLDKTLVGTEALKNKGNAPGAIPRSLQQRDASANSAMDMNDRLLGLYGIKGDERVGWLEGKGKDIKNTLNPQNDREIRAVYKTYREERFKAITGGAPTESVMKEIDHDAEHKSTAQIITDLQNDKKTLKGVQKYDQDQRTNQPEYATPEPSTE